MIYKCRFFCRIKKKCLVLKYDNIALDEWNRQLIFLIFVINIQIFYSKIFEKFKI